MRRPAGRDSWDLVLTAAAAVALLVLLALPTDGLVESLVLVATVLVLPGYALAAAMFPPNTLPRAERVLYVAALSVAAVALGGLLWQLAFPLGRVAWACVLSAITLAACGIAQLRRGAAAPIQDGSHSPPPSRADRRRLSRADLPTAIAVAVAVAATITAVAIASEGLREQRAESHFSALWIAPRARAPKGIEVAIDNHQGAVREYRLTVSADGREIESWRGKLGARKRKALVLAPGTFRSGARLVADLYRDGALYRRTELQTGAEP